jgi:hypothetical protein
MGTTSNRFVSSSDDGADELRLTDSPPGQTGAGTCGQTPKRQKDKRQGNRHESADDDGGEHPCPKDWSASREEIVPVHPGCNEGERENDRNQVPSDHPALEAADEVAGQGRKEQFHTQIVVSSRGSHSNETMKYPGTLLVREFGWPPRFISTAERSLGTRAGMTRST